MEYDRHNSIQHNISLLNYFADKLCMQVMKWIKGNWLIEK